MWWYFAANLSPFLGRHPNFFPVMYAPSGESVTPHTLLSPQAWLTHKIAFAAVSLLNVFVHSWLIVVTRRTPSFECRLPH